jgi:hypothetical protein
LGHFQRGQPDLGGLKIIADILKGSRQFLNTALEQIAEPTAPFHSIRKKLQMVLHGVEGRAKDPNFRSKTRKIRETRRWR